MAVSSFTSIAVLTELYGLPWDDPVMPAYVSALRPSAVRVIEHGHLTRSNAIPWRVTVYLTALRRVREVVQEVQVELPEDGSIEHGYALQVALHRLRERYGAWTGGE